MARRPHSSRQLRRRCLSLVSLFTYLMEQVVHFEHPELGYKVLLGRIVLSHDASILGYGGPFWTIVLVLSVSVSLFLGRALSRHHMWRWYHYPTTVRFVTFGAFYFFLYHVILLSHLYADYELLNAVMIVMLMALTLPFGAGLGYAYEE
jgi:hypothetical protein